MTAEAEVLHPGLFSTIQDRGRFGFLKYGVPVSGVMDKYAAKMANLILNNPPTSALLEITQLGPKIKFNAPAQIVITGGDLSPALNERSILHNHIVEVEAGDILSFGRRKTGCRSYLGVAGGFLTEEVLDSKSWYDGITSYSHLIKGMTLKYMESPQNSVNTFSALKFRTGYISEREIIVSPGPEFDFLPQDLQQQLLNTRFSLDMNNNRMAVQLQELVVNRLNSIITGPVIPGTIQLTPSGKLIILMRDCQTTGGYPRVLQVSEDGINAISQKVVGEKVHFKLASGTETHNSL